jgi:hypothetical protein
MRNNEGKWQDSPDFETVFHEGSSLGELEPWNPSGERGVKVPIPPDLFEQPAGLDLDDLVPDGKLNQIAVRTKIELPHNIGPVGVHGLHAEV